MLNILAKTYDDGGPLVSVRYALFEGDPRFIKAVEYQHSNDPFFNPNIGSNQNWTIMTPKKS